MSRTTVGRWIGTVAQDIRFALRSFRLNPGFTTTAVVTLALGIAAATSVVSVVDATLLRPLPFPRPDRIVDVGAVYARRPQYSFGIERRQSDVLRSSPAFESLTEYASWVSQSYTVPRADGARVFNGVNVSPDFFTVFRVRPARGRAFTAADENVARPAVCILTATGVRRLFNGQRDVIGRTLSFVEGQVTVVGVMADRFWYPMPSGAKFGQGEPAPDLMLPWPRLDPAEGPESMHAIAARLKPGVTVAQAHREAVAIARVYGARRPDGSVDTARVRLLQDEMGSDAKTTLLTLFGVVACLLLICCVNIANLLLSQSNSRIRELALRTSLGAGRLRLFRQLLTEHLVLAGVGGLVAVYLTVATLDTFVRLLPQGLLIVPVLDLDLRMLGLAALVTVVTGLLCGFGPALIATRANLSNALKAGGDSAARTPRWRSVGSALLVVEAAVLLILLSGGGLLVNTLLRLKTIDLGFTPDRLWTAEFIATASLYPDKAQVGSLGARMAETLRRLPGVTSVGESDWGVLGGFCPGSTATIVGRPDKFRPQVRHVSAGYFKAVNMSLRDGRVWTARDENVMPRVAVINAAAARAYWPKEDPVGRRVVLNKKFEVEVIGVMRDLREANEREAPGPSIYLPLNPFSTRFYRARTMVVRTAHAQAGLARDAVASMAAIDPRLPVTVTRADEILSDRRQDPRFYAVFVGVAAAFGLLLAAVGIGGLTAQGVVRRTREIGVRLALGAEVTSVVGLIVRQVCAPVVVGVSVGVAGALVLSRVLKTFLYEITPQDPLTHTVAVGLLLGIALVAAVLPARRAARINPVDALRTE